MGRNAFGDVRPGSPTTVSAEVQPCLRLDCEAWFDREDFCAYLLDGYWVARMMGADREAAYDYDAFTYIEDTTEWLEEVSAHLGPSAGAPLPLDIALAVVEAMHAAGLDHGVVWFCGLPSRP